ncbi:MAG: hypothetical protein AUI14_13535 [Actinobacteria bacterium 13_2_20CM_2_71_6]|nr:MAG: hypothetical protein AUI14_13535 [Actinobacteria bacterium 13_2_20CM_2_71_6]
MAVRRSNPVLTRLGQVAQAERQTGYAAPPPGYGPPQGYPSPVSTGRAMTLDDVVTRTIMLVLLTVAVAAVSWFTLRVGPVAFLAAAGSSIAGLVLALVISFARVTNPLVISLYAVLEGVVLGVISRVFEYAFPGIVVQAVVGTLAVFGGMAVLYKTRVLRATPRFTRWVIGALIGVVALSMLNWVFAIFGGDLGLVYYGPNQKAGLLAIVFSLVCIGVGALTFILDFDAVEQGVRYGLPERYAWYCAFGLLVGLVFLYWQILRLLGYLRQ